ARRLVPAADRAAEAEANRLEAPIPDVLVQQLFERQAEAHPERVAVVSGRRTLTYGQLLSLARRWGRHLRGLGAVPKRPAAVVREKGWEQIVAAFGALTAGCPYLPLDAAQPPDQLAKLMDLGGVDVVLTQSWVESALRWPAHVRRVAVDREELLAGIDDGPLDPGQTPDDLAYILFTSGSTGVPKGAMIAHRGVVNALIQTNQVFGIGADDRALGLTALHHDMSLFDV